MAVSIIAGGQYGSEGKGKTAFFWAEKMNAAAVVRVGGTNSGHTVYDEKNRRYALRMLPTASIRRNAVSVLPAGSYIDVEVLLREMEQTGISREQLKVDPNAVIISERHRELERKLDLGARIGSTLSGTGAAVMARAARSDRGPAMLAGELESVGETLQLAGDLPMLAPYLEDTKDYMRTLLSRGEHIVVEGTQGYGLSNYHAPAYPYATSRDTTAAGFLAETGLSPFDVEHIVMVIRAFPIRVAGSSGPLEDEIDWDTVSVESGASDSFEERTTVTDKVRRVARFSPGIVRRAIMANRPDVLVLNHVDYIDASNKNADTLTACQRFFLRDVENKIGRKVDYCGNGEMKMIYMGE